VVASISQSLRILRISYTRFGNTNYIRRHHFGHSHGSVMIYSKRCQVALVHTYKCRANC
jgi:hypothetical protein